MEMILALAMAASPCPHGQRQFEVRYNEFDLLFSPSVICASNHSAAMAKAKAMNPHIKIKEVKPYAG